ncbi:nuclear transport factor 2 family protein [Sphingomonas sp. PAMC 26605]|uniref:nuclear transport factor 2 family protein n=1 Tax=Sphingomonas sp. PAMC 26605 TaxID=1112214 RepID=UPI00026CCADF|nr:nuclear transport factor 2 family protein [Sphingomonas sp. PAMC 26605]
MLFKMLRAAAAVTLSATPLVAASYRTPVPATFESRGVDRRAIEAVLGTYTRAVSTKNQALFESLLLSKAIPFSGIPVSQHAGSTSVDTARYEDFRKGVFEGEPFTQRFQDIHIAQDGALAQVSLVFVNTTAKEDIWGWKTMQLVRVGGQWKIAAEFFTGHA